MKRHPALQDLSRDHHFALVEAQALRRMPDGPDRAAQRILSFWDNELRDHFREEEDVLLPIYGRRADLATDRHAAKLTADHAWLRDAMHRIEHAIKAGEPLDALLTEVGRRLEEHARFEERQLFPAIEEALTEADLDALAERSRAHRLAGRGAGSVGPRS